ncbi:hypothetical protein ACRE_063170 [Hapsidospora chrysogenum ATCC 11550]|uniref:DAGKc domain-containing protein n=1 Tax=Hapsidospora chrysogenum (strain ATCC 11550 / CBS 779.69 / DSM 880 / IAM 14645 / JCM 23072 / IMI 49137) TaxID=857340 RepID=A0A086T0P8_HAPC1|nr:hypothetical protein ACRE_063170 [Hapsidospora chrysogenum ATCC 11550]
MADDAPNQLLHPPELVNAGSVQVNDGRLAWTGSPPDSHLTVDNVVLVLKSARNSQGFIICCLKEQPSGESGPPFELVLLRSDTIPDHLRRSHLAVDQLPHHLLESEVDIIVSTKSGTGLALDFWQLVLHPLWKLVQEELGAPPISPAGAAGPQSHHHVLITQDADSVTHFSRRLWSSVRRDPREEEAAKSRTVVLLSGDGGVVDLLNGRSGADDDTPSSLDTRLPSVALLPLGTGNALFHSLHKPAYSNPGPSPLVLGLRTLFQGSPASLPVFRASFSPGAHIVAPGTADNDDDDDGGSLSAGTTAHQPVSHLDGAIVASYGFHASVVYESDTPAYRVHGDKRFGMVAQELLRESHPYTAHVEMRRPSSSSEGPGQLEALPREEHAYVLTTLVSNLERAFTISPASNPLDGQLRTVHFGNVGGARAMEAMMKAYDGGKHVDVRWDDGERIYYEEVDEIRITVEDGEGRWRKFCVDGTTVGVPKGGQMTVKRLEQSPLQILVNPSILKQ